MNTSVQKSGPVQISDDPLASAIVSICDALKADFGDRYKRAYQSAEELRQFKRRLYSLLRGKPVQAVVDGYERCVSARPGLIPTAPEIASAVDAIAGEQRREDVEERRALYARKQLPSPEESANRSGDSAEAIRLLAEATGKAAEKGEAGRSQRLAANLQAHEILMGAHYQAGNVRRAHVDTQPCASGCGKPGTLGHSIAGNSRWYCRDCFFRC